MNKEEIMLSIYDSYAAGEITESERDDLLTVTEGLKDLVASFGTKKKAKEQAAAEKQIQKEREETKQKEEARQKKEEEEAKERQKAFLAKLNKAADKAAEDKKAEKEETAKKSNQNVILSYVKKCTEIQGKINDTEKEIDALQKKIDKPGKDDNVKSLQGKKKYQEAQIKSMQKDIDTLKTTVKREYGYNVKCGSDGKFYAAESFEDLQLEIYDTYAAGNITESERDILLKAVNEQVNVISCDDEEVEEATRATEKLTEYKEEYKKNKEKIHKLAMLAATNRGTDAEKKILDKKLKQLYEKDADLEKKILAFGKGDALHDRSSKEYGKLIHGDTTRADAKEIIKMGKNAKQRTKSALDMEPAKEKDSIKDELAKILKEK